MSESDGSWIIGVYTPNVDTACAFLLSILGQNKIQEGANHFIFSSKEAASPVITEGKEHILAGPRLLALPQRERRQARVRQQEPQSERELFGGSLRLPEVSMLKENPGLDSRGFLCGFIKMVLAALMF